MYNQLLDKSIQKEYKKAPPRSVKNIENSISDIVGNLDLQDNWTAAIHHSKGPQAKLPEQPHLLTNQPI